MPKVSVILTTYNRPDFLPTAVNSVIEQTFKDYELIIADDNSSMAEQKQLLDKYRKLDRVKVYVSGVANEDRKRTCRYATTINYAVSKITTGDYITYLCDDDRYKPKRLELMVKFLDEHPEANIVYGTQVRNRLKDGKETYETIAKADRVIEDPKWFLDHSSFMHRRFCFDEVGGWNDSPDYWQKGDVGFYERLMAKGWKFYPIEDSEYVTDIHVYHDNSYAVSARYLYL